MRFLFFIILASCAAYTDPEQEKLTYYMCEKEHEILVKHSDDYESIVLRYNKDQQVLMYNFVTASGVGYQTDNLLWLTKGKEGKLIEKLEDGTERILLGKCKAEKEDLQF